MKAFITGITGFAGSHLAELCIAEGIEVSGLSRDGSADHANLSSVRDRVELHDGDVADEAGISRSLAEARPDLVFHLAAETGGSEAAMLRTTVLGTVNLVQAAAALASVPKVLVAGSSAVYGRPDMPAMPIDERQEMRPVSSYGLSKATQDALAGKLGAMLGVDVIRARAFNQTGPRESARFVAASVARQIAEIEAGRAPPVISVGRTDTKRDFSDVRDMARGYLLALTRGKAGEIYNLASGRAVAIEEIVQSLLGMAKAEIMVEQDEARMRPSDIECQIGDAGKARAELGWTPEIELEQTLRDLLEHMRGAVSGRG
jgi:GDP-4-dehydro-6-deoxy-D-mannose reductase